MVAVRYPEPLRSGDRIEVPAPSMGVPDDLHERLRAATTALTDLGFRPRLRPHATIGGITPATAQERAQDLHAAFSGAGAVLPPWGGQLAIELVDILDWDAVAEARTWFVGWSDISTLLLPLTILTGTATLHGANLMDEPWEIPAQFRRWTDVAALTGRHAPEGVIVYLESAGSDAPTVLRMLRSLRLAGWFRHATGILVGRDAAPAPGELDHAQAADRALGDLGVPVVLDFDIGHQPPQLPLVNGALANVTPQGGHGTIIQHLVG